MRPLGIVAGAIVAVDVTPPDGTIQLWVGHPAPSGTRRVLVGPLVGRPGVLCPRLTVDTPVAISYHGAGRVLRIRAVQVLR